MPRDERYLGESAFYDPDRDEQLRNALDVRLADDEASIGVGPAGGNPARHRTTRDRGVIRVMRGVFAEMRREARRAAPVRPLWKHRTEPLDAPSCPACGGSGWCEDPATGEEWPCPSCNEG